MSVTVSLRSKKDLAGRERYTSNSVTGFFVVYQSGKMGPSVVFTFLLIALCCHGYGALPAVESTTESKNAAPSGKLEAKAGGISVRFGNFEADDKDKLMFPGISNRAFGSFGSASSSSLSSSSDSSSSSSATSSSSSQSIKKVGGGDIHFPSTHPERPAELQQIPVSPCQTCCKSNPCGAARPPYIPDQGSYGPPPPPQYGGSDGYNPDFSGRPYPGFVQGGSGSYSNSQASSSSGYHKYGNNGYQNGGNQIFRGYPGGNYVPNHVGGGNPYYPARPIGSGSSASSSSNSYAGSNNAGYPVHPGYPGVPGFNQNFPGAGSFSSSSSSSSAGKGGSYSSSNSQSSSVAGNARPVRPVQPPYIPEVPPEFSLPDGMCGSSAC